MAMATVSLTQKHKASSTLGVDLAVCLGSSPKLETELKMGELSSEDVRDERFPVGIVGLGLICYDFAWIRCDRAGGSLSLTKVKLLEKKP